MSRTKTKSSIKEKAPLPKVKCKGCFLYFHPADRRQKFHSATCRARYYNLTYFHSQVVEKLCENPDCGKTFTTSCPVKQKFCCSDCRSHYQLNYLPIKKKSPEEEDIYQGIPDNNDLTASVTEFRCITCGKMEKDGVQLSIHKNSVYCLDCLLKL